MNYQNLSDSPSILFVYRNYQKEKEEKEKYIEKLERLEHRYLNLNHAFNLHIDICRSYNKGVQYG